MIRLLYFPYHKQKKINVAFVSLNFEKRLNDSLTSLNDFYENSLNIRNQLEASYRNQINLKNESIAEQDAIIEAFKKIKISNERKITWLKAERNVLAVAAIAASIKIFVVK